MAILSIQSHVAYGYVGNKAAVFPLQSMGYDVWPVNTVQFSNHTGYGIWQGEVFSSEHIRDVIAGIEAIGIADECEAILSGYMGSSEICHEVQRTVENFKGKNSNVLYLCDPIIGNTSCFVKPEVLEFFKTHLHADIITPNQFEAETLSGISIKTIADLKSVANYFHDAEIGIVVITGVKLNDLAEGYYVFISYDSVCQAIKVNEYSFLISPNGTGDLFSAVFLGSYLANKNPSEALQRTVYLTDQVMQNTFAAKSRELKIIGVNYAGTASGELPQIIDL
ncbi:MAG: pyridoxal kinase [Pseudomonadota bacterium]|nr:pyridoxal kinase [Pseudomonadota bacterium]